MIEILTKKKKAQDVFVYENVDYTVLTKSIHQKSARNAQCNFKWQLEKAFVHCISSQLSKR